MSTNYAYQYAVIRENGLCTMVQDTTNYILDRLYIPVEGDTSIYMLKYYYPIPESVSSFDDFTGTWWNDAAHTDPLVIE